MVKIIDQIIDSSPQAAEKMETACIKNEWKEVRAAAHSLGSTVEIIGNHELKDMVNKIEEYAEEKSHLEMLPQLIREVRKIIELAIKELESEKQKILINP